MDFFYKKIENKGPAVARIGIKGHAPLSQFLNSSFILQLRKIIFLNFLQKTLYKRCDIGYYRQAVRETG